MRKDSSKSPYDFRLHNEQWQRRHKDFGPWRDLVVIKKSRTTTAPRNDRHGDGRRTVHLPPVTVWTWV